MKFKMNDTTWLFVAIFGIIVIWMVWWWATKSGYSSMPTRVIDNWIDASPPLTITELHRIVIKQNLIDIWLFETKGKRLQALALKYYKVVFHKLVVNTLRALIKRERTPYTHHLIEDWRAHEALDLYKYISYNTMGGSKIIDLIHPVSAFMENNKIIDMIINTDILYPNKNTIEKLKELENILFTL